MVTPPMRGRLQARRQIIAAACYAWVCMKPLRWIPLVAMSAVATAAFGREDAQPFQRGVCYASTWRNYGADGYGSTTSQQTLDRLRHLGVEWISLTPFGFMESVTAPGV